MKIPVYDLTGTKKKDLTLNEAVFSTKINQELIAQAVRVHLSNQRQASARSKTRADVDLSGKKIFRQKGTGNARHGSRRAPIFVGGGKAHGPKLEQHYQLKLPKKIRRGALKSALSQRVANQEMIALEGLAQLSTPSTKQMATLLHTIAKEARSIGFVLDRTMTPAVKSVRNLDRVICLDAYSLTAYDVLKPTLLVFSLEAVTTLTQQLSNPQV